MISTTRRRRRAGARPGLAFSYRVLFYALATAPIWGVVLVFAIICQRLPA